MEFKIGDSVKIKEDTRYYNDNKPSNPNNVNGRITRFYNDLIYVLWPTHKNANVYHESDLKLTEVVIDSYSIY